MRELGYEWVPVPVTTEDNYELTLFNIKGQDQIEATLPPVLIMHGLFTDAAWWIEM